MAKERIAYIDVFRGWGILLMVMGHVGFGGHFDKFIHAFHMPMFFIVSGLFYRTMSTRGGHSELKHYLHRKCKTLLVPYICFGGLHYLLWLRSGAAYANWQVPLLHLLWVNTEALPIAGALWFLTALLGCEVMYALVNAALGDGRKLHFAVMAIVLFGYFSYDYLPVKLPWALNAACIGMGLFHIGRMLHEALSQGKLAFAVNLSFGRTVLCGFAVTLLIFLNGYINMRTGSYGFFPLFYVNAVLASLVGLNLAKLCAAKCPAGYVNQYCQRVGRESIAYLCLNQLAILAAGKFFRILPFAQLSGKAGKLALSLAVLVMALALLYVMARILLTKRLAWLLGKGSDKASAMGASMAAVIITALVIATFVRGGGTSKGFASCVVPISASKFSSVAMDDEMRRQARILAYNMRYLLTEEWREGIPSAYSVITGVGQKPPTAYEKAQLKKGRKSFAAWRSEEPLYVPFSRDVEFYNENALRPWAHTAFVLATGLRYRIYDEDIVGISRADAQDMTIKLIAALAQNHGRNTVGGWGHNWQSALWAEQVGFAAWLLWEDLPDNARENVARMVASEADRLLTEKVPYYRDENGSVMFPGDSKGEENAWNSRILALAACMMPEHEHNGRWQEKLREYLVSATSTQADGRAGSNIEDDGTVINHNVHHIDYMTVIAEGMLETVLLYGLADKEYPPEALHHHDLLYTALVHVDLGKYAKSKQGKHFYGRDAEGNPSDEIDMPEENDWGGKWYASYYLMDTEATAFSLDKECPNGLKAENWRKIHLVKMEEMIDRQEETARGKFFIEGENKFVSGETYMMHNLCKAFLMKALGL